ncbi:MAG: hypothetical protein GY749_18650 [Desulfobacteraceae bacterium]|nr:hypothetical protein [Desulfobacteraceae bacterium]
MSRLRWIAGLWAGPDKWLLAGDLDAWLDTVQGSIPGTVAIIYDACRSGSFLSALLPPDEKERILVTSTDLNQESVFVDQGTLSFSFLFWSRISAGDSFYDSFVHGKTSVSFAYNNNHIPQLDGNGIPNEKEDKLAARDLLFGCQRKSDISIPEIGKVMPPEILNDTSEVLIYAENVSDKEGISRVWAVITPPCYLLPARIL